MTVAQEGSRLTNEKVSRSENSPSVTLLWLLGLVFMAGACDLSNVEIPVGESLVVVHGVMRPDQERQFIIVEESFAGDGDSIFFLGRPIPTEDGPPQPLEGATVLVTNYGYPDDPCGSPVLFEHDPGDGEVPIERGVYWAPPMCPSLRAGDSLGLYVETPDGEVVTGTTVVTGMESAVLLIQGDTVPFGMDTVVSFNRDHQTLRVRVEPISGRLLQVEVMRVGDLDMDVGEDIWPGAKIFADTTRVTLPGDLVDASGWSDGGDVFRPGRRYIMAVSITDVNFFDFGRSNNNKFTGRGFINHVEGGIGVFGSLTSTSLGLTVLGNFNDLREGIYWVRGSIQGVAVDAELTLFMARTNEEAEVSGFLTGDWFWQAENAAGVNETLPRYADSLAVDGTIVGNAIHLIALQPATADRGRPKIMRVSLIGDRKDNASFVLSIADSVRTRSFQLGTLTVTQQ